MGPSTCIEKVSPELKSTSNSSKISAHARGLQCEQIVLDHYLKKSFTLIQQRCQTPFAEVDLVLRSPQDEIVLVEVKSLSSFDFLTDRVSPSQKQRLMRAFRYFLTQSDRVRMELAVVSQDGELLIFDDVFG